MTFGGWKRTEQVADHTPQLLLVSGVLLALAGLNRGLVFLMAGYDARPASGPLLLFGILAAAVAIIGIYWRTRKRSPRLAKVAGGSAALSLVAFGLFLVWIIASRIGPVPGAPGPLAIVGIVSFMVGITLAGVTVIRSSNYPALVGYLLIGEAVALLLVFVVFSVVFPGQDRPGVSMVLELSQAVVLLGAGYFARNDTEPQQQNSAV